MKRLPILSFALTAMLASPTVLADATIHASLSGYDETPSTLSTTGTGSFTAKITKDNSIEYELTYSGLEGKITQAHIHFGRPGTTGGIAAWLCQTATNLSPVATTPFCAGQHAGTVTGTIRASDVIGPAGQGIAAGEFEELLDAIREGATYANVHSTLRQSGEIRGVIK